ncbi:MAG: DUF2171 domain-containing protein [Chloroflexi bacterium]|nr:DUF2171 domain-containing protein [Chloroflexota bacterium]
MNDTRSHGIQEGMEVLSCDGERLGSVVEVRVSERGLGPESGMVVVHTSDAAARSLAIPFSVVRTVRSGQVVLDVTGAEARGLAWRREFRG